MYYASMTVIWYQLLLTGSNRIPTPSTCQWRRDEDYFAKCATHTLIRYWKVAEETWTLALEGLFEEPMSELRRTGMFTSGGINVSDFLSLCNRIRSLWMQPTTYHMDIVGSILLVDKTRTRIRCHRILVVDADQWGLFMVITVTNQLTYRLS